jgi:uncharacterized protein with HEPN domain
MQDSQVAYLLDILRSAEVIQSYIEGYSREDFLRDPKTQDAVLRRLLVIGEAAAHLTPEIEAFFEGIPFRKRPDCAIGSFTTTDRSTSRSYEAVNDHLPQVRRVLSAFFADEGT